MIRYSVITDEISQDLQTVIQFAKACHLQGLEIRSLWEKGPFDMERRDIAAIREAAEANGLSVCSIAAPFFKCSIHDEAAIRAHLEGLKRCCEWAHLLGAGIIRGFSFWQEPGEQASFEALAEKFAPALAIMEKEQLTLALEPDPSVHTPNGSTLARLLLLLSSPWVGAMWDPGNLIFDPNEEEPYPAGYEAIRPYLRHVHLKDALRENGRPRATAPGEGWVNWEGQIKRLISDHYNGFISFEPHYRLDRQLDEAILRLPGGSALSEGGPAAGLDAVHHWDQLLKAWQLSRP